jgi:amidase/aspartyl-tRNA(Asn)/glutamyl-tRNA(Gln) amidotransferase subunit A
MPAVATDALLSDEDYGECGIKLAGTEFEFHLGAVPAIAFGILSGCPVLTIPSFVRNGILRAHRWSRDRTTVRPTDRTVLGKGRALEKALPYFR